MTLPKDPVEVVSKATGRKQFVPRHFLDNPVLMAGLELPPSAKQQDPDEEPDPDDLDAEIEPFDQLEGHQDLDDRLTSDDTESSDETPA